MELFFFFFSEINCFLLDYVALISIIGKTTERCQVGKIQA